MLYREVYDGLRQAIRDGEFAVGGRLPSDSVLTERFGVSAITIKKALDLLRNDGYVTRRPRVGTLVVSANPSPAPTGDGRSRPLIGCVLTSFDDTFGTRVLEGLLDEAGSTSDIVLKTSRGSIDTEEELIRNLVGSGISGLVLLPSTTRFLPPVVLELVLQEFPVVVLDRSYDDINISAVYSDNVDAAKRATEFLFDLGHTRVGFVTSAASVSTTEQRRRGYVRAHAERHLPLDPALEISDIASTLPGSAGSATDVTREIERLTAAASADHGVTAYVVTEYNIAVMLREACLRAGRRVPDDVSIVCFDHLAAFSDRELFRFTHIEQDQPALGRQALRQVLEQIRDRDRVAKTVVPSRFVEARSTAPLARA